MHRDIREKREVTGTRLISDKAIGSCYSLAGFLPCLLWICSFTFCTVSLQGQKYLHTLGV